MYVFVEYPNRSTRTHCIVHFIICSDESLMPVHMGSILYNQLCFVCKIDDSTLLLAAIAAIIPVYYLIRIMYACMGATAQRFAFYYYYYFSSQRLSA